MNSKKKTLFLCIGATTMYMSQIPECIKQLENSTNLTSLFLLYPQQSKIELPKTKNKNYVKILTRPYQLKLMMGKIENDMLDIIKNVDYIYCRGHLAGVIGTRLKSKNNLKAKIVVDFRGGYVDELAHEKGIFNKFKYLFFKRAEKKIVHECDQLFVVSEYFKNYIVETYGENYSTKINTIRPFINTECFKFSLQDRLKIRKSFNYSNKNIVLLYVGGISWWNCIDETLILFRKLYEINSNYRMIFITPDVEEIRNKIKLLNIDESIISILKVQNKEMPKYLSAADFGTMLRRDSITSIVSYPTKFTEYLLTGLPVIIEPHIGCYPDATKENSITITYSKLDISQLNKHILNKKIIRNKIATDYLKKVKNKELLHYFR